MDEVKALLSSQDNDRRALGLAKLNDALVDDDDDQLAVHSLDEVEELLKPGLKSSNPSVNQAALRTLPTLYSQLSRHHQHLKHAISSLLPVEKLADAKEPTRRLALEAVAAAAKASLPANTQDGKDSAWSTLAKMMDDHAFHSKNARAREQAISFVKMTRSFPHPPPLRPFTPLLLPLLGDSDQSVRHSAQQCIIDLFSPATVSDAARSDLQKELAKLQVQPKTRDAIMAAVFSGANDDNGSNTSESTQAGASSRPATSRVASTSSAVSLPAAAFPSDPASVHEPSTIVPVYIATAKDLSEEFEKMRPAFDGKETEHNWIDREKHVARMRGYLKANVQERFADTLLAGVKANIEGILKAVSSLRTTLATSALSLVLELSQALKHQLDPLLDTLLGHLLPMASQTKKIVASASQATVAMLLTESSYHLKTVQSLRASLGDKSASARAFIAQHFGTLLKAHGLRAKQAIESSGGLDIIKASIAKALADANPAVREAARSSYWQLAPIWPAAAEDVRKGIDATGLKLLDKANPHATAASATSTANGASVLPKSPPARGSASRPSVREMIAQKKREGMRSVTDSPLASKDASASQMTPRKVSEPASPASFRKAESPASPSRETDELSLRLAAVSIEQSTTGEGTTTSTNTNTSTPAKKKRSALSKSSAALDVFQDSPDKVPQQSGSSNLASADWWLAKSHSSKAGSDSDASVDDIDQLIRDLRGDGLAASAAALSKVSKARSVENDADEESIAFWTANDRLPSILSSIRQSLADSTPTERQTLLVVLKDIVENQAAAFESRDQTVLFSLLITLRDSTSGTRDDVSAAEAIARIASDRFDPILGLNALLESSDAYLASSGDVSSNDTSSNGLILSMIVLARKFARLPMAVLEDVVPRPRCAGLLLAALNDARSGQVRRHAVLAIVAICRSVASESASTSSRHQQEGGLDPDAAEKVFGMLEGEEGRKLRPDQKDLLSYYFTKEASSQS